MAVTTPVGSRIASLPVKAPFPLARLNCRPGNTADDRARYRTAATSDDAADDRATDRAR